MADKKTPFLIQRELVEKARKPVKKKKPAAKPKASEK